MCAPRIFMPASSGCFPITNSASALSIFFAYTLSPVLILRPDATTFSKSSNPAASALATSSVTHSRSVLQPEINFLYSSPKANTSFRLSPGYFFHAFFRSIPVSFLLNFNRYLPLLNSSGDLPARGDTVPAPHCIPFSSVCG